MMIWDKILRNNYFTAFLRFTNLKCTILALFVLGLFFIVVGLFCVVHLLFYKPMGR